MTACTLPHKYTHRYTHKAPLTHLYNDLWFWWLMATWAEGYHWGSYVKRCDLWVWCNAFHFFFVHPVFKKKSEKTSENYIQASGDECAIFIRYIFHAALSSGEGGSHWPDVLLKPKVRWVPSSLQSDKKPSPFFSTSLPQCSGRLAGRFPCNPHLCTRCGCELFMFIH